MSITVDDLDNVERLCSEVQQLIRACRVEMKALDWENYHAGSATSGTLRRRSMDLTRALSDMRRP